MRALTPSDLARRIRVRSILLSSYRRRADAWLEWLRFQMAKGFIPAGFMALLGVAGAPIPLWLSGIVIAGAIMWMLFVGANAFPPVVRLERRRAAFLKAAGYDLGGSVSDRKAWRHTLAGNPPKEYPADVKAARRSLKG